MKEVLIATIHQLKFRSLKLNDRDRLAVRDIQDSKFWKAVYTLLRAVYPGLRSLRMADGNKPAMAHSYHLTHRTTTAINKSVCLLNDEDLFGSSTDDDDLAREDKEIYGEGSDEENEGDEGEDDDDIEIEDEDDLEGEEDEDGLEGEE